MKKTLFLLGTLLMLGSFSFEAQADIFNVGGVRTKIYSYSKKSFDGADQEVRAMAPINAISNNGPLNVIYVESEESKVIVEGTKDLFCRVQTQYKEGTVSISLDAGTYRDLWLQVVVYAPKLMSIKCMGEGDVTALKVNCTNDEMSVRVMGSATVRIDELTCEDDLDLHITGSGDVKTKKISCQKLDVNVTGSGDVKAEQATCGAVEVTVSGSGGVQFSNIEGKDASLSVAGSGCIAGSVACSVLEQKTTGSGSVLLKKK